MVYKDSISLQALIGAKSLGTSSYPYCVMLVNNPLHDDLTCLKLLNQNVHMPSLHQRWPIFAILHDLRWSTKNSEPENLPPTGGALDHEMQRINHCVLHTLVL